MYPSPQIPYVSRFDFLKKRPNAKTVFTGLVMFMWASSFLMDMANPKYDPPDYVNPLIMLVGGYLFATAGKGNGGSTDKAEKEKKDG